MMHILTAEKLHTDLTRTMLTIIIRHTVFPTKELRRLIIASLGLTEHFEITARQSTSADHKYIFLSG